jgi:hypothetical protein
MPSEKARKIIITGTGRAGTTFLVELLTELGLDTGYTPQSLRGDYDEHCHAGLEHDVEAPSAPYIVKNPALSSELPAVLARGHVVIEHVLIPVRQLDQAARSRIHIGGKGRTAGGLTGTDDPSRQKDVLAENFHTLVETITAHDIPHTFLHFPRFAHDAAYTFEKLRPLLGNTARGHFDSCFAHVARPELIHTFDESVRAKKKPGPAGQSFRNARRVARQTLRFAAACLLVGLGWLAGARPAAENPAAAKETPPPASSLASTSSPRLVAPDRLPTFQSPPFRTRPSLALASLEVFPERSFPSHFGPINLLNRPRPMPPFTRNFPPEVFRR